ncbi:MAG: adenine deaminase [Candidatus Abyssobacteria bacterium SURF_17]|uniref:Adenine deaminase n=1 Tax=Candidatus Abyssobacteria bacterium SURF_17 TaxID=2093361 RepID=A0A419ERX1_9BACT|nr:MAG: adenine deaminase [Candidatus Abyssubacteria bacterium SURF_17]
MTNMLAVARGEAPCDVLLKRARLLNVFTGEIEAEQAIAIFAGRFAGIGDYEEGRELVDLAGSLVAPGFIDGHIHLESTHLTPAAFASLVVPRGTMAIVADPHEIVNVKGLAGLRYMIAATHNLPISVYFMVPSCVPVSDFETSGASLSAEDIADALQLERVIGLAEMMNYPGVVQGEPETLAKLAVAHRAGVLIDGHCPGLHGHSLNAYIASGVRTDHETTKLEEGREKLRRGMFLMIREGSSEKNLEALLPLVTGHSDERCMFVSDDCSPNDLAQLGHIDHIVRKAIRLGLPATRAYALATINPARYFRLHGSGAIAPGYNADFMVLDNMEHVQIAAVYHAGRKVAEAGRPLFQPPEFDDSSMRKSLRVSNFSIERLRISANTRSARGSFPAIEIIPKQITTRKVDVKPPERDGLLWADPANDLLKLAVVERHVGTGNVGLGFVRGFGITHGAIASSVAHDSHNIVVAGASDEDMFAAVSEIIAMGGGMVAVADGQALARLPLPIAGLLSDASPNTVITAYDLLERSIRTLGCRLASPMATLSFLALPVIPELRLTDKGLVDVVNFQFLDLSTRA